MIEAALAGGAEARADDAGEGHPVEEVAEDGVGPQPVDAKVGHPFPGGDVTGPASMSCIHDLIIVY
ncbi:MAG: hypothetical protein ACE5PT_13940 [Gemmatimonadales bacterium]